VIPIEIRNRRICYKTCQHMMGMLDEQEVD